MILRHHRKLEIIRWILCHTQPLHDSLRAMIAPRSEGYSLPKLQEVESITQCTLGSFSRVALAQWSKASRQPTSTRGEK